MLCCGSRALLLLPVATPFPKCTGSPCELLHETCRVKLVPMHTTKEEPTHCIKAMQQGSCQLLQLRSDPCLKLKQRPQ
jgi:hypothetical protein